MILSKLLNKHCSWFGYKILVVNFINSLKKDFYFLESELEYLITFFKNKIVLKKYNKETLKRNLEIKKQIQKQKRKRKGRKVVLGVKNKSIKMFDFKENGEIILNELNSSDKNIRYYNKNLKLLFEYHKENRPLTKNEIILLSYLQPKNHFNSVFFKDSKPFEETKCFKCENNLKIPKNNFNPEYYFCNFCEVDMKIYVNGLDNFINNIL